MRKDFAAKSYRRRNRGLRLTFLKSFLSTFIKNPVYFFAFLFLFFVILPFATIAIIARDLPTPGNIMKNTRYSTSLLDRNNKVIYQVYEDKNIIPVNIDDLPEHVIQATIAIEDKNFFKHKGFSIFAILRALAKNIFWGKVEGGSTLTQQLVKNTLLTPERTLSRKIKEFILAIELERRYSKKQILEMYLNQTPYGGTAWGIESASQLYFGKHAKDLTLLEAAVLAGFPQSPSRYSPYIGDNPKAYIDRSKQVLRRLREDGYINKAQEKELADKLGKITFRKAKSQFPAPHFVFYVKDILDEIIASDALYKKGLIIKTTLDLDLQREAEKIVRQEIAKAQGLDISNAAVVIIDPNSGEILALVGSVDFNNEKFGKFNAALGLRQPGSTLKPFTYALALEKGFTASSVLMDVPTTFTTGREGDEPYTPENYDGKYRGPLQTRFALGSSINVPAVKMLALIGLKPFLQRVSDAGLTTLTPTQTNLERFGLSITLGGGEVRLLDLVSAYSVFANGGTTVRPIAIKEVRDYKNKLLYKPQKQEKKTIFSKEAMFIISHILSDNNARLLTFGANNYLNIPGKTVAAKTGTTDDKRDNWTIGYTKNIVVGVWVGNNDNSPMNKTLVSGLSGAAPIWNRIVQYALTKKGYKDGIIEQPKNVEAVQIDALFGGLPYEDRPVRSEYFIKNTVPTKVSPYYKKLKISKATGKLANALEIASNNFEEKMYYVVEEEDPLSEDGKNRWQEAIDLWAAQQEDSLWKVPKDTSEIDAEEVIIDLKKPQDKQKFADNNIEILAKAISAIKIKSFKLYVNDTLQLEKSEDVIDTTIHLDDGVHSLKFVAVNDKDKSSEKVIKVGIKQEVAESTPTLIPTPTP